MVEFEASDKKVIQELIKHVNELDGKVKDLDSSISDFSDLEIMNKLDIINLKNEIDKLKLLTGEAPAPAPPQRPQEEKRPKEKPKKAPAPQAQKGAFQCQGCSAWIPVKAGYCPKCGKRVKR